MNLIAYTKPDVTIFTDASSHGMGGFSPVSGLVWRIKLSTWIRKNLHINTVEFIAPTIDIWLETIFNKILNI